MAKLNHRLVSLGVVCALVILGLLIAVIVLATRKREGAKEDKQLTPHVSALSILQQLNVDDGLNITWYINSTSIAREGVAGMLNVELTKEAAKFYSNGGQLELSNILDNLKSTDTGIKIKLEAKFQNSTMALELVRELRRQKVKNPVIITLPVFSQTFNWQQFLSSEEVDNDIMISFDLTVKCCDTGIGRGTVEYVDILCNQADVKCYIEVDIRNVLKSWQDIKWLLNRNHDVLLIISDTSVINNESLYDSLTVRNDIDKNKVLYNFGETLKREFLHVASTAGSPLLYFDINPRDAGKIIWSHNTDTWEQINKATSGEAMMIEGDIMLLGQDTSNQTELPIMAHTVGDYNNMTFEQWLDEIIKVDKGMKFDFKSLDAVKPALRIVQRKRDKIKGPIWLNADILTGPNATHTRIPADDFLDAITQFPEATLSLGWTTVSKRTNYNLKYTMAMVQEMQNICRTLQQPITFPVRAEQLVDSWDEFNWLLKQSRRYTLTVWTSHTDNVTKSDMNYIKQQAEASRVYFDLPEQLRPTF